MVKILADEHELIFGFAFPLIIVEGKALAAEVENVALRTFVKPENALGTEDVFR